MDRLLPTTSRIISATPVLPGMRDFIDTREVSDNNHKHEIPDKVTIRPEFTLPSSRVDCKIVELDYDTVPHFFILAQTDNGLNVDLKHEIAEYLPNHLDTTYYAYHELPVVRSTASLTELLSNDHIARTGLRLREIAVPIHAVVKQYIEPPQDDFDLLILGLAKIHQELEDIVFLVNSINRQLNEIYNNPDIPDEKKYYKGHRLHMVEVRGEQYSDTLTQKYLSSLIPLVPSLMASIRNLNRAVKEHITDRDKEIKGLCAHFEERYPHVQTTEQLTKKRIDQQTYQEIKNLEMLAYKVNLWYARRGFTVDFPTVNSDSVTDENRKYVEKATDLLFGIDIKTYEDLENHNSKIVYGDEEEQLATITIGDNIPLLLQAQLVPNLFLVEDGHDHLREEREKRGFIPRFISGHHKLD